jgi:hypothetical protein
VLELGPQPSDVRGRGNFRSWYLVEVGQVSGVLLSEAEVSLQSSSHDSELSEKSKT